MIPLLVVNAPNIAIQRSFQRRGAIVASTAFEKENIHSNTNSMSTVTEGNANDIPSLRGWFLKEKRDSFRRRQNLIPGASSNTNRRWFAIERISSANSNNDNNGGNLALSYFKKSNANETEQRCGWIFLNDVLSLDQDKAECWIIIEHPTRILRIQSPTPAQHRVWFSTLSKCCKNVRKEVASPSSSAPTSGDRRPSLIEKFISEDSVRKLRKQSLLESPDTPSKRDELQFLREITGTGGEGGGESKEGNFSLEETKQTVEYEEKPLKRSLFSDASQEVDDLSVSSVVVAEMENVPNKTRAENKLGREFSCEIPTPSVPQLGARLSNAIINSPSLPPASEEKTEIEPIYYDEIGNEDINDAAISCATQKTNAHDQDMAQLRKALSSKTLSQKVRLELCLFII